MASKDFINSSPNRSKNRKSSKDQQGSTSLFSFKQKIVAFITIVGIGAGGFGLWKLSQVEPLEESSQQPKPTRKVESLPEPPEEKWDYIEDLKNKEVAATSEYEVTKKGPYQMQCGSFKSLSQAQQLKANIAFSGIESQIRKTNGSNGVWYKVILGPYSKKREAERDKHKLKNNNINYCQIWLWR